jgi:hypothetical protein
VYKSYGADCSTSVSSVTAENWVDAASDPHTPPDDERIRTLFVDAKPAPLSCKRHGDINVQVRSCRALGPFIVNIPRSITKSTFVTPGLCPQQRRWFAPAGPDVAASDAPCTYDVYGAACVTETVG